MKFHVQKYLHQPEKGTVGDCHRTSIACLLGLERDEVPEWTLAQDERGDDFHEFYRRWFNDRGMEPIEMQFPANHPLEDILYTCEVMSPGTPFLLSGQSKTGCNHTVVAGGGRILHDPSLTHSGIVGPCVYKNGKAQCWFVTYVAVLIRIPIELLPRVRSETEVRVAV